MYIDYSFYIENGGTITNMPTFDSYCRKAKTYIDYVTCGNIAKYGDDIPYEVKSCMVDIIDEIADYAAQSTQFGGSNVKSISNNGISITMEAALDTQMESNVDSIIRLQLAHLFTPDGRKLTYRGVIK